MWWSLFVIGFVVVLVVSVLVVELRPSRHAPSVDRKSNKYANQVNIGVQSRGRT